MSYFGVKRDGITDATIVIPYEHHEVHDGCMFRVGRTINALANGASQHIVIKTPDSTTYAHWGSETLTDVACQIHLYEDSVVVSSLNPVTTYNKNRTSSALSTVSVYTASSVSTLGTDIMQKWMGTGKIAGGEAGTAQEWILKPNSYYTFKIINKAGSGTLSGSWRFLWYEHTQD